MQLKIQAVNNAKISYYIYGAKPKVLILSGIHGDEFEVIGCLKKSIRKHLGKLPDFIFIPEMSPSAVLQKTRFNKSNIDLNRGFLKGSADDEVKTAMKILRNYSFEICLSFHEDLQQRDFYFYDSGNLSGTKELDILKQEIKSLGINLFNGIDDPDDPVLGYEFKDGYSTTQAQALRDKEENGTFGSWAMRQQIIKRIIAPEIPGFLCIAQKQKIVDVFLRRIVWSG